MTLKKHFIASVFVLALGLIISSFVILPSQASAASTPAVGDSYEGGIVAYILQAGDPGYVAGEVHGLIAAPSDQSNGIKWNNGADIFVGAELSIGTGNSNTEKIITAQGDGSYAAKLCADLDLNGYTDWYLPSINELRKLYLNKDAIGGFVPGMSGTYMYWSSSEESATYPNYARYISMGTGLINESNKSYESGSVRAIRSFSYTPPATVVSTQAISGIIAPIMDATPTNTIADTSEYTATILWSGNPTKFSASTVYTATITITPKAGYTLTGVSEDFFTVEGAVTTNPADSGVVTAVFPATVNIAVPTLTTSWATSVTTVSAVFNGNITNIGGEIPTIRGFQYGTTTNYGTTITEEGTFTTGVYISDEAILTCGTTYHYHAFATNNRTGYGNDKTFKTNSCPTSTWIERIGSGQSYWGSIASSADGTKLIVAVGGGVMGGSIFTSTNSGKSWAERTNAGSRVWNDVTSSADGTKLAAAVGNGYIYTSDDSGLTWAERTNSGSHSWQSIASSSDGIKLSAVAGYGADYVYISTNGGLNWTTNDNSSGHYAWRSITSSSDGMKLAAATSHYLYTSDNGGLTWNERTGAGDRIWNSITSSADGMTLAVTGNAEQNSYIYTSTNGGITWNERTEAGFRRWNSIASSDDGTKLVAVDYLGSVYISTNSGVNWIPQSNAGTHQWKEVVSSSDGVKLAAIQTTNSYIYTYLSPDAPTTTTGTASNIRSTSVMLNGSITGMGGENPTVRGFEYGRDLGYGSTATDNGTYDIGNFSKSISSLKCETLYHYRAYTINSGGTGYGDDGTFTTSNCSSSGGGGSISPLNLLPLITQPVIENPLITNPTTLSSEEQLLINQQAQQVGTKNSDRITSPIIIGKISRLIKVVTIGDDVKVIQNYLNTTGYNCGNSDGIYGNKTKGAVITFQKAHNLIPDGIVGPKTLGEMN